MRPLESTIQIFFRHSSSASPSFAMAMAIRSAIPIAAWEEDRKEGWGSREREREELLHGTSIRTHESKQDCVSSTPKTSCKMCIFRFSKSMWCVTAINGVSLEYRCCCYTYLPCTLEQNGMIAHFAFGDAESSQESSHCNCSCTWDYNTNTST